MANYTNIIYAPIVLFYVYWLMKDFILEIYKSKEQAMIQITKIEPEYLDTSDPTGRKFLLNHYEVHFNVIDSEDIVSGVMRFDEIGTTAELIEQIKKQIIQTLNAANETK